jgi:hypothetical protein
VAAGFTVGSYTNTDDWRRRITAVTDGLADAADEIADETGQQLTEVRADIEQARRTVDDMTRRVLILARRNPTT